VPDTGHAASGNTMKNNTPYVSGDTYISNDEALRVYQNMGYTFDKGEFIKGMNVELEHQDVTDGSLVKTAMIAAAHLREVPNYYTLLLKYVEPKNEQLVGPDGTINGAPTSTRVKKMRKSHLQELIQEVLDEVMNEGNPETKKKKSDWEVKRGRVVGNTVPGRNANTPSGAAGQSEPEAKFSSRKWTRDYTENTMNKNKPKKNLAVKRHGKDVVKKTGTRLPTSYEGPDAMGPTWDQQHTTIGRSSAKSGGLDNPNAAANRKAAFKENTMPTLQEILMEGKENRVLLTKLTVLMEKLQPDFTKVQATKMMELCSETHQLVNTLNTLPYTIYNHMDWKVLKMGLVQKLMEVKVEAEKINSEKLNTTSFIKALDELIVQ
jgi:hypothetical protein